MFKSTRPRSNQIAPAGKEKIVLAQLSLTVAFIMLAFSSCSTASSYRKLANSRITTVQMSNGDAIWRCDSKRTKNNARRIIRII